MLVEQIPVPRVAAYHERGTQLQAWNNIKAGDECSPMLGGSFSDIYLQAVGVFSGATVTIAGTALEGDPSFYLPLNDVMNVPLVRSTPFHEQIMEHPRWIKPIITGGDENTNITIAIYGVSR